MALTLSDRINSLAASATIAMSQKSAELRSQGLDVINLAVGEPDFFTPDHIKRAAHEAIDANYSFYSPVAGFMELRQAIADNLLATNGVSYSASQIVVSGGAKQAICNVILSLINPGDEVVIPTPAWVSYVEMVKLAEGVSVNVPATIEENFKMTPERLEAAITPRTRMVLLCSPSNPSGAVYSRDELQGLVDVIKRYPEIMVVSDEIYQHINFTGSYTSMGVFPELEGRVVVINGVSKAYAMTGWRIGFMAGPEWVAKGCTKLQGQYTSGVSSISQKAAEAAYRGSQACVEEMRKAFERRRNLIVELMSGVEGVKVNRPDGAFYLFPDVSRLIGRRTPKGREITSSGDVSMYLLEEAHVATVDGAAFCLPGYIRLSYATSDDNIREACRRIAEAIKNLK